MSKSEITKNLNTAITSIDKAKTEALEYVALMDHKQAKNCQPFCSFSETNRAWASLIFFIFFLISLIAFYHINFDNYIDLKGFVWLVVWSIFGMTLAAFTSAQNTNPVAEKTISEFIVKYFVYFASVVIFSLIIFLLAKKFIIDSFSFRFYLDTFWIVGIFIGQSMEIIPYRLLFSFQSK